MIRRLRSGGAIALIAPSSPFDAERFSRCAKMLEDEGYRILQSDHLLCRRGYLAGTEQERVHDLIAAVADPDVAAIICVRGGYGSGRLLPWIPFATIRKNPKIFLGYSDVTFLHLAFQARVQWPTFHGPNLLVDSRERLREVLSYLRGERAFAWDLANARVIRPGVATGRVVGGNLTCMAHLLGTPYFPDLAGALLLIEDRGEALYRVDRLITHLKLAGVFSRINGLILGHFKDCGAVEEVWAMVEEHVGMFRFPVVAGLPFGHDSDNQVLPFGIPFTLDTYGGTLQANQSPFSD